MTKVVKKNKNYAKYYENRKGRKIMLKVVPNAEPKNQAENYDKYRTKVCAKTKDNVWHGITKPHQK